jgi:hypothetical protein
VDHAAAEAGRSAVHYSGLTWIRLDFFGYFDPRFDLPDRMILRAKTRPAGGARPQASIAFGPPFPAGGNSPDDYRSMDFSKYLIAKFRTILASGLQSSIHGSLRESRGRASQEGWFEENVP